MKGSDLGRKSTKKDKKTKLNLPNPQPGYPSQLGLTRKPRIQVMRP